MPERFLSLIVTMLPAFQEIEQRLDRETGRRFNAFNLFPPNEVATSRILAFLLDPTEAHGQKDVFLRLFIQRFVPSWKHAFKFGAAQKKSTTEANEAIDVTISDGSYWLGIENKIFEAEEQPQQALRYLNALRQAASHQGRYCLVYLSPGGAPPTDYSLPEKEKANHGANLVCGAWTRFDRDDDDQPNIMDWLAECRHQCQAENVVWLIRQFAAHVGSVGPKESDMVRDAIVKLALKDQNLEAALRIGESFDAIRLEVATTFLRCVHDDLQRWAQQQGEAWEVVESWPGGNWIEQPYNPNLPLLLRKKTWPPNVGVAILAERSGPWNVFVGICGPMSSDWTQDRITRYGEQTKFVGPESRQRIAKAIGLNEPKQGFLLWWDVYLRDAAAGRISDWRDINTVTRLHSEKKAVCEHITLRMTELAEKIGGLVIDET